MDTGKVVIISGPSCAGKDTTIDEWMSFQPLAKRVITSTTRNPRDGEIHGVHYYFLTQEDFQAKIQQGDFLEYAYVHGKLYGISYDALNKVLNAGGYAIIRVDVQGALSIMPKMPNAITIFINAPSMGEIERRMRAVRKESEEEIQLRLRNAIDEIECSKHYQHYIINHDYKKAAQEIDKIVTTSK